MEPKNGGYMKIQNPYNNEISYIEDESGDIAEKAVSKLD